MNFFYRHYKLLFFITLLCLTNNKGEAQVGDSDNTSKVPKYSFANTIDKQENQLKTNPLMKRLKKSRNELASDPFRPIYHYVNPEGMLNDPNGLSYWNGKWHLFYQAYPPEDPRQHWGHAISEDLVHWRDLPYAIYPGPERHVFSGATLVEEDRVIAMYHGTGVGNMVAVSSDPLLLNWEKLTGNAVIPLKNSMDDTSLPYSVFDPSIWKKGDYYYSLSAGRSNTGPGGKPVRANHLFKSKNLEKWEYLHEFVENDRFTLIGDDGACPYFWPIGEDKYIMNFFSHMSGGQYLLGDYDKEKDKFVVTSAGKFNHGAVSPAGVHAPSATVDGKGGVVVIFNMNPGKPTEGWNQIMTLPRRLTLLSDDELGQEPAGDLSSLHHDGQHIRETKIPANEELVLENIQGNAMEISAEIDLKDSNFIELNVLRSPNKEEYTRIIIYKEKGFSDGLNYASKSGTAKMPEGLLPLVTGEEYKREGHGINKSLISIESSYSSILPDVEVRAPETAPFLLEPGENVRLRVFIDKSVVEVFVNGKQAVAMRVYPGRDDSLGVSISSRGKDAELISLDAWQMKSIYNNNGN